MPFNVHFKFELRLFNTVGLPESNGYIYVEANGGLNQQRTSVIFVSDLILTHLQYVSNIILIPLVFCSCLCCNMQVCNAVAVAGYLNATLLIPNFRFHSIWRDPRFVLIFSVTNFLVDCSSRLHYFRSSIVVNIFWSVTSSKK